jgi:non-ribosomal peptide synthetase component F
MSLRRFAGEHHLTLGTLVMGAWALLHAVRNPSGDVLLGVTVSGRPPLLPGVEGMIGPFINNVPVRVGFPAHQTLVSWLQKLQDRQQEIQGYSYISRSKYKNGAICPVQVLFLRRYFCTNHP